MFPHLFPHSILPIVSFPTLFSLFFSSYTFFFLSLFCSLHDPLLLFFVFFLHFVCPTSFLSSLCDPLSPTPPHLFSLYAAPSHHPHHCQPIVVIYSLATTHCHRHSQCGRHQPPLPLTAIAILFSLFFVVQVSLKRKSLFLAYGFALILFFFNGSWSFCANFCSFFSFGWKIFVV